MIRLHKSIQCIKRKGETAFLNTHANRNRPRYTFVADLFPLTTQMATQARDNQCKPHCLGRGRDYTDLHSVNG